jgi:hypothetical protein
MVCLELKKKCHPCDTDILPPLCGRWGLIFALLVAASSILFFGAFSAMTGISLVTQPFLHMIGGVLLPGKPLANMFFVLYSYSE